MPTEPYLLGSHSGCCGIWASGPTDLGAPTTEEHAEKDKIPAHLPQGWSWGYRGMTAVKGLFTAARTICVPLSSRDRKRPPSLSKR
jgi:adenylylsulfate reductase subunit A